MEKKIIATHKKSRAWAACEQQALGTVSEIIKMISKKGNNYSAVEIGQKKIRAQQMTRLIEALSKNKNIKSLDISWCKMDLETMKILFNFVANSITLKELILYEIPLNNLAAEYLRDALIMNKSLEILYFGRFEQLEDTGAECIALAFLDPKDAHFPEYNDRLKELTLHKCGVGPNAAAILSTLLKNSYRLKRLSLSDNDISHGGTRALGEMLKDNHVLAELNLSGNTFPNGELSFIYTALTYNKYLKKLDLHRNELSNIDGDMLHWPLSKNKTLKSLDLSVNDIHSEGIEKLAMGLELNNTLEELDLSDNEIDLDGAKSLAKALKKNQGLKRLDLSSCGIGYRDVKHIMKALRKNKTLERIRLNDHNLSHDYIIKHYKHLADPKNEYTFEIEEPDNNLLGGWIVRKKKG